MDKKMHSEPQSKGMSPRRNLIDESKDFRIRSGPSEEAVQLRGWNPGQGRSGAVLCHAVPNVHRPTGVEETAAES